MKKVLLAILAFVLCFSFVACANYDREQYRADVLDCQNSIIAASKNLNQIYCYMGGYWMGAKNKDGTINDPDSMVVSALDNASVDPGFDIVDAMSKITEKHGKVSEISVSGDDKEIKMYIDLMYDEYCNLSTLIISPKGTQKIWNSNVYDSTNKINDYSEEILRLTAS